MVALVIIMTINQQTTAPAKHSCKISKIKASYNMNSHTIRKKTRNELSNIELSASESYQRGFMPCIQTSTDYVVFLLSTDLRNTAQKTKA
jgi:hypothetical protein